MAKLRTVFNCTECGAPHYKWGGKCDSCGSWNSLVEEIEEPNSDTTLAAGMALIPPGVPQLIGELDPSVGKPQPTGIGELDRVLDGGLVPGSVTLLGGEPGIGRQVNFVVATACRVAATHSVCHRRRKCSASSPARRTAQRDQR